MMRKYKSWLGITVLILSVSLVVSSCGSSSKYACPNRIEVLP